ncbi:MAG: fibronectin type III domain-containing protein [Elusimicrobia bacterium]|nr:fibronectin type III domain-containing protein [Elusimicrobiota bacterium]
MMGGRTPSLRWVLFATLPLLALPLLPAAGRASDVSGTTVAAVTADSLTLRWTIASVSTPTLVLSSTNFQNTLSSGTGTLGQSTTYYGNLSGNTTYWFQVKNSTEDDGGYVGFNAGKATSTLAALPAADAFSGITVSALQANWLSSGNGPGTRYDAVLSTGPAPSTNGFAGNKSSSTSNAFALFNAGLGLNVLYYAETRAVNNNGIPTAYVSLGSTATLSNAPTSAGPTGVDSAQLTVNWGDNGNPSGTTYLAVLSLSAGYAPVIRSSETANTSATFQGLLPNTTYHAQVQSVSRAGAPSTFTALPSTSTLAAAPGAAAFSGVTASAVRANWTSSDNGAGTRYEAILSAAASPSTNGLPGNKSSSTLDTYALFDAGLAVNATYYVEVRAVNNNGVPSAYASLGSTVTLPNAPTPAAPTAVAAGGLTANWTDASNPAGTRYLVRISSDAGFAVRQTSNTAATSAAFTGLDPGTTYYAQVQAVNFLGGASAFTALPSTSTLAAAPVAAAFSGVTASAVQANWTSSNGPGTSYEAILSAAASPSTNGLPGNKSSSTFDTYALFNAGLAVNATYYVEVRAVNSNAVPTAYTSLGSTVTLPNAPTSAAPTALAAGGLTANWGDASNPAGTRYLVRISSDAGFAVRQTSNTAATSAAFTGLLPNTTYFTQVQAVNFAGGASAYAALPSTSTLAAAPGAAAFSGVTVSSVQANWTSSDNGRGVRYEAILSSAGSPSTNGWPGNKSSSTFNTFASFSGLTLTTTYYVDVRAVNNNGVPSAYASLGSTVTNASTDAVAAGEAQTIVLNSPSGEILIDIPAAAFSEAVQVLAQVPASFPASAPDSPGLGAGVEITLVPAIQPSSPVTVSIGYAESQLGGIDEKKLIIARYDAPRRVWVPLVSTPDPVGNKVTARTAHFSLFQVVQSSPRDDLSLVRAFPNPLRPNQGQAAMTFINLPAGAKLKVYNYLGQKIRDLGADNAGMASWDGKGRSDKPAASGVYAVLIEGAGAKRTFMVAVER